MPLMCPLPSSSPLVAGSLFSVSVSLFLFCYVHSFALFFIPYYMWNMDSDSASGRLTIQGSTESFRHFLLYFDEEVINYTKGIAFLGPSIEKFFQIATWSALKSRLTPVWKVHPPKELFSTNCRVLLCYETSRRWILLFFNILSSPNIYLLCHPNV